MKGVSQSGPSQVCLREREEPEALEFPSMRVRAAEIVPWNVLFPDCIQ